jgi:hypothetical protein
MKNDSKRFLAAKVDLQRVRYVKPTSLGIDFTNEIDLWSKMEFRYCKLIKNISKNRTLEDHHILRDLNSLVYAIREKID